MKAFSIGTIGHIAPSFVVNCLCVGNLLLDGKQHFYSEIILTAYLHIQIITLEGTGGALRRWKLTVISFRRLLSVAVSSSIS